MTTETAIARRLVAAAIAAGYLISVRDGIEGDGELTVQNSTDLRTISDALQTTEGDKLILRTAAAPHRMVGTVTLIWGNGEDLISDHTDTPAIDALVALANG